MNFKEFQKQVLCSLDNNSAYTNSNLKIIIKTNELLNEINNSLYHNYPKNIGNINNKLKELSYYLVIYCNNNGMNEIEEDSCRTYKFKNIYEMISEFISIDSYIDIILKKNSFDKKYLAIIKMLNLIYGIANYYEIPNLWEIKVLKSKSAL